MDHKKILVLHGPNLNLLGNREPAIYGTLSLFRIDALLKEQGTALGVSVDCRQSNHEGELVDYIQEARRHYHGLLINPAALTHYSYSLREALLAAGLPAIEIHLSNIFAREEFRRRSVISPAVRGVVCGLGLDSYRLGLQALVNILKAEDTQES